ncbi:hypothetical protein PDJAM_G00217890, partial [Pangasius djambal]|nr:hypothetical protein [Pangasius djambal]
LFDLIKLCYRKADTGKDTVAPLTLDSVEKVVIALHSVTSEEVLAPCSTLRRNLLLPGRRRTVYRRVGGSVMNPPSAWHISQHAEHYMCLYFDMCCSLMCASVLSSACVCT